MSYEQERKFRERLKKEGLRVEPWLHTDYLYPSEEMEMYQDWMEKEKAQDALVAEWEEELMNEYPYKVFVDWREGDFRPGVEEWLEENCPGEWDAFLLPKPNGDGIRVDKSLFLFKSKEVAFRFKLEWG